MPAPLTVVLFLAGGVVLAWFFSALAWSQPVDENQAEYDLPGYHGRPPGQLQFYWNLGVVAGLIASAGIVMDVIVRPRS